DRYASEHENRFLFFTTRGLNGTKKGLLKLEAKRIKNEKGAQEIAAKLAEVPSGDKEKENLTRDLADKQKAAAAAAEELTKTLEKMRKSEDTAQQETATWWDNNKR